MNSRGNLQRKCVKAHPKAAGKCSSRCIRWYRGWSCPAAPTAPAASSPWAEVQAIYDRLAVSGRRDGNPGGLAPRHNLAVHRCLHRALAQAVTWRLLAHNPPATPPVPRTEVAALAPEQVAVSWTPPHVQPALAWPLDGPRRGDGARNGELCGLEWADLDLDAGTVRFRQGRLPSSTPPSSPTTPMATAALGEGGGRKELAVGPLKSTASNAMFNLLPPRVCWPLGWREVGR
jgi:hypothetical protein